MDRLRELLHLEPSDGQEQAPTTTQPVPITRPVVLSAADDPQSPTVRKPAGPAGALNVAQGQELMGPCQGCDGYWTREVKRGQKPQTCPVCKREGPPSA